jgi:cytochrome c oxidase cbb3-type subunit I/II
VTIEEKKDEVGVGQVLWGRPLWFSVLLFAAGAAFVMLPTVGAVVVLVVIAGLSELWWVVSRRDKKANRPSWFALIEARPLAFTVLTLIAILIGGIAELLPTILVKQAVPATGAAQKPYSALELQGRDLYVREGCYTCHSQMVRPLGPEATRFGEPSRAEEFIYDHPFQWGSKRTGPDLHRLGGRYPNLWHYTHMMDPRATSPGSNMPAYTWLEGRTWDLKLAGKRMAVMQKLGVPYTNAQIDGAETEAKAQAAAVSADLAAQGVTLEWNRELVPLIAYLQRLGRDTGVKVPAEAPTAQVTGPAGGN